jgi:hypothetical protein
MSKLKIYCSSCGSVSLYAGEKPSFCQSCGFSFVGGQPSEDGESFTKSSEHEASIPDISKLDVEITKYEMPNETLGQIAGTLSPEANKSKQTLSRTSKKSEQEILAEFRKEAGPRGRNPDG